VRIDRSLVKQPMVYDPEAGKYILDFNGGQSVEVSEDVYARLQKILGLVRSDEKPKSEKAYEDAPPSTKEATEARQDVSAPMTRAQMEDVYKRKVGRKPHPKMTDEKLSELTRCGSFEHKG